MAIWNGRVDERSHEEGCRDACETDAQYAVGEVTGGIHGNNRIGGNAVCDITVFGKSAGEVVAKAIQG